MLRKIYLKRRFYACFIVASICFLACLASLLVARFGISPLIIAVILGALLANFAPKTAQNIKKSGIISVATKQILRLGIILYGFKITLNDIYLIGLNGLLGAFLVVFSVFLMGYFLGVKMGLDKKLSALIASGSAICGAAAVMAANSVLKASSDKVAVAVATVVVFGTLGMFLWPLFYLSGAGGLSSLNAGFMVGAGLHEVAHAVAAGGAVGASEVAVTIKMMRVMMLVPFLLILGAFARSFDGDKSLGIKGFIPWFAVWFLAVLVAGSLAPSPLREVLAPVFELFSTILLSFAMAALGLNINKNAFKGVGGSAFKLAGVLFIWLFILSFLLSKLFF